MGKARKGGGRRKASRASTEARACQPASNKPPFLFDATPATQPGRNRECANAVCVGACMWVLVRVGVSFSDLLGFARYVDALALGE